MIADIFNNCLTILPMVDNLAAPLSSLMTVRGESRKKQQMPIARLFHSLRCQKLKSFYGVRYWGSFGSRGSVATSLNPFNAHRQIFERIKRCSLTFNRVHTMSQNKSVQQATAQTKQAIKASLLAQLQKDIDNTINTLSVQHLARFHKALNQVQVVHDFLSQNLNNDPLISFSGFQQITDINLCCLEEIRATASRETNSHKKTHN